MRAGGDQKRARDTKLGPLLYNKGLDFPIITRYAGLCEPDRVRATSSPTYFYYYIYEVNKLLEVHGKRDCIVTCMLQLIGLIKAACTSAKSSGSGRDRMATTSFGIQREGSEEGILPTNDAFFSDRSQQYVETKGSHPGPNPIRTHFGNGEKRRPGGRAKLPEWTQLSFSTYSTAIRRCGCSRYNRRRTNGFFQDRSHQYVETKG